MYFFNVDDDAWNMEFTTDWKNVCTLIELLRYKNRESSDKSLLSSRHSAGILLLIILLNENNLYYYTSVWIENSKNTVPGWYLIETKAFMLICVCFIFNVSMTSYYYHTLPRIYLA